MTKPVLSCHDVIFKRPSVVIDHVSLSVYPEQVMTIIGPNGGGKTTLIHLMLGLLEPTSGSVWRKPGLILGYMPQRLKIDSSLPLTVEKFLKGYEKLLTVFDNIGIIPLLKRSIHHLSGGEWQRVLLARSVLNHPDVLVLDEPLQSLDHGGQIEFYHFLTTIRQMLGCSIIHISHDLHLVWDKSDTIVCLNKHICCQGTASDVLNSQSFQQLFQHYIPYVHKHDHAHI